MKKFIFLTILLIGSLAIAQNASPTPAASASSSGSNILSWLETNWSMICTFLLAISEGLGFTKFGGILSSIFSVLKQLGANTPSS